MALAGYLGSSGPVEVLCQLQDTHSFCPDRLWMSWPSEWGRDSGPDTALDSETLLLYNSDTRQDPGLTLVVSFILSFPPLTRLLV